MGDRASPLDRVLVPDLDPVAELPRNLAESCGSISKRDRAPTAGHLGEGPLAGADLHQNFTGAGSTRDNFFDAPRLRRSSDPTSSSVRQNCLRIN